MSNVALNEKIPNNVDLASDKRLQRALEQWQPAFISWWKEMGPDGFQAHDIYLRTAISVDPKGWAHFDHVRMPDYRWGIFLAEPVKDRTIGFGDHYGEPAWQEVPGEYRNSLRRLIVTQGDTEPASVEQQRRLGATCPSVYDLRNLFQVNVEEGRHLWAMVYLLHSYFGRDGREEAEELLQRRSGDEDKPRILGAFNEPCTDWLSFFMFTTFTDRDGKYQLLSLSESGFDPLSRTCRFMLTEEAHHMFVGETGIGRVLARTVELMKEGKDPRKEGAIDLETLQRYLNFWYSVSLDLFGSEVSTNAANFFAGGLKGRAHEENYEDHLALEGFYTMDAFEDGRLSSQEVPLRSAMNEVLRDAYVDDCEKVLKRWNRHLEPLGLALTLPSRRFHRNQGMYAGRHFDLEGKEISEAAFEAARSTWLPTEEDRAYVQNLMVNPVYTPGHFANWIAPPPRGINSQPLDFEYVRYNEG